MLPNNNWISIDVRHVRAANLLRVSLEKQPSEVGVKKTFVNTVGVFLSISIPSL